MSRLTIKLLGIVAFVVFSLGATILFQLFNQKQELGPDLKEASTTAMQVISLNQEMHDRLGSPITMGHSTVQRVDKTFGGRVEMTLNLEVSGPKNRGHATVTLLRSAEAAPWAFKNGNFFPLRGPPVRLAR